MSKGIKHDQGKLRYDLVPVEVHEGLCDVITYGAAKYSDNNWKNVEPHRYEAAALRHFNAYRKGEKNDPESGKNHLFHAMACLAFLYEHSRLGTSRGFEMERLVDEHTCGSTCRCGQLPGSGITEDDLNNMARENESKIGSRDSSTSGGWDADSNCCLTGLRQNKSLTKKQMEYLEDLEADNA